eukprot:5484069-Pyramimonas_sp.AAC.1
MLSRIVTSPLADPFFPSGRGSPPVFVWGSERSERPRWPEIAPAGPPRPSDGLQDGLKTAPH